MRRLRLWWWNATHARCPVCRDWVGVGREWQAHKAAHDPGAWRAGLFVGIPAGTDSQGRAWVCGSEHRHGRHGCLERGCGCPATVQELSAPNHRE